MAAAGGDRAGGRESAPGCAQAVVAGSPGENAAFPRALRGGADGKDRTGGAWSPPSPPGGCRRKATGPGSGSGGRSLGRGRLARLHDPRRWRTLGLRQRGSVLGEPEGLEPSGVCSNLGFFFFF